MVPVSRVHFGQDQEIGVVTAESSHYHSDRVDAEHVFSRGLLD